MKTRITEQDYIKANRKAAREEEIAAHGHPIRRVCVHKSKKSYDRSREKAAHRRLPDFLHCCWVL